MFGLIFAIVRDLISAGLPPAISDKPALREWLGKLASALSGVAGLIPGSFDDKIVELLNAALADDLVWDAVYELITHFDDDDADLLVGAPGDPVGAVAAKTGIDPVTIITIIKIIVDIIRTFRK